ncbi:hypothetical protein Pmani_035819 [Petrolisthes manimaculis]|uniref:Uncharacterized protein n=1 Tax=Petrolisthes manimaculis TaxID=1843537 RepID=A0AAE1TMT3_9EUCA|nr:hypothetical protein Pmani_035819 [Petrolisthes manimaculis]
MKTGYQANTSGCHVYTPLLLQYGDWSGDVGGQVSDGGDGGGGTDDDDDGDDVGNGGGGVVGNGGGGVVGIDGGGGDKGCKDVGGGGRDDDDVDVGIDVGDGDKRCKDVSIDVGGGGDSESGDVKMVMEGMAVVEVMVVKFGVLVGCFDVGTVAGVASSVGAGGGVGGGGMVFIFLMVQLGQ